MNDDSRRVVEKWRSHIPQNPKAKLEELKERAEWLVKKANNKNHNSRKV